MMSITTRRVHVLTLILIALVVSFVTPWCSVAPVHADGARLRVTVFDDRVVDGTFSGDTSNKSGSRDGKRSAGFAYLHDASGAWIAASADTSGDYLFPNVTPGAATLYFAVDGPEVKSVVRDAATGAVLTQRTDVSFSGGSYIDPAGHQSPHSLDAGQRMAEASVTIGGGETKSDFAITAIQAVATVGLEGNSLKPVSGHADIAFLSNGATIPARDDGSAKYRTNADMFFPAMTMGITVKPVEGFHLVTVTAETTNGALNLKRQGNTFTLQMEDLPFSAGFVEFRVVVAPGATPGPTATQSAGAASPAPTPAASESAAPAPPPAEAETAPWVVPTLVVGAAVVLIAALVVVLLRRRARARAEAERLAQLPDITAFATPEQRAVLQRQRDEAAQDAKIGAPTVSPMVGETTQQAAPNPWKVQASPADASASGFPGPTPTTTDGSPANDPSPATGALPVIRRPDEER